MKSSILFFTMIVTAVAMAQPPDTLWTRTFGGGSEDIGNGVQHTTDGGYIVTGYTYSYGAGSADVWLIKTDSLGNQQWNSTFGGSGSDVGQSVQQTNDGGYVIAGYTRSYGAGGSDVWLIKTDSNGDSLWTRTFGGSSYDYGYSVQQTSDGGYIIVGYTSSYGAGGYDVWLIKTDSDGDSLWTRTFGGSNSDEGYSVQQTNDGGYVITGWTNSYGAGSTDVWLIKTDSNGDSLWTRTFGGGDEDRGNRVQQTDDGGYVITGWTSSYGAGSYDVWLIKTESDGNCLWTRTFGQSYFDWGNCVQQTTDGGYIISGCIGAYSPGSANVWLIKTDPLGVQQWQRTFGGSGGEDGNSVQQTADGGYVIAGQTTSYGAGMYDVWLIRLAAELPLLSLSLDSLNFNAEVGGTNPADQQFQITNAGGGSFDYTLSEDIPWLNAAPMSGGPVPPTDTVQVSVDISGLSEGDYFGDIIVTAPGAMGSPDTVHVTLHIEGVPELLVSPDSLAFNAVVGGVNPADQNFRIENIGGGSFDYTIFEDITWLSAAPMSGGPVPPTDTVQVSVDISGLSAGDYEGDIIVTAPGAQGSPDTVQVTLHIEASDVQPLRGNEIPTQFALLPAFPNPFNLITRLTFEIPRAGKVTLNIYNVQGKKVSELYSGWCPAGTYHTTFDASDLPSGIYFCRMVSGNFTQVRKMFLLK
jgi:hypothetical protein